MKNEYAIINIETIQKRIEEINVQKKNILKIRKELYSKYGHTMTYFSCVESWTTTYSQLVIESRLLNQLIAESTPLIPVIEDAFYAGCASEHRFSKRINEYNAYINNLKLDI